MTLRARRAAAAANQPAPRHVCVVLHDVSPARWAGCTRVLRRVHAVAQAAGVELPVTLLVVPRMHGKAAAPALYLRWLHRLARAGHELALHGFTHQDDGPPASSWHERLLRQTYTAGEGEFAALTQHEAALRLAAGRGWAQEHGLQMRGFVAPAWLLNEAAWQAVTQAAFDYTCTRGEIVALPSRHALPARSLVFSTRAAWRRWLSVPWNRMLAWQQRQEPLLRLELHPGDCDHPHIERCWTQLLARALRERGPLRLYDAAMLARGSRAAEAAP